MPAPWRGWQELHLLGSTKDGQTVTSLVGGGGHTARPQGEQERGV